MMQYYKANLCVEASWLVESGVMTESNYRNLSSRHDIRVVRRGCRGVAALVDYESLPDFFARHPEAEKDLWLATTKAPRSYEEAAFSPDCFLFFGKETAGLPKDFREAHYDRCLRLPMRREARSLNLSNSVAILTYEALRQNGFPGLLDRGEMAR